MLKSFDKRIRDIFLLYIEIPVVVTLILYPLLPKLLNYPPNSIDNAFQQEIDGLTYSQQYIILISISLLVAIAMLIYRTLKARKQVKLLATYRQLTAIEIDETLHQLRYFCFNTPFLLYLIEVLVPLIMLPIIFLVMQANPITILKICLTFISFLTLGAIITFVFSKTQFNSVLELLHETYKEEMDKIEEQPKVDRLKAKSLSSKMFLQFSPLILVAIIIVSLVAYVQNTKKIGEIYYNFYYNEFAEVLNKEFTSQDDLLKELSAIKLTADNHCYFILDSEKHYLTSEETGMSSFLIKYIYYYSDYGLSHAYDYYCTDSEAIVYKLNINNLGDFYIGVKYDTSQYEYLITLATVAAGLYLLITLIIIYVANSLSKEIKDVAVKLENIARDNSNSINLDESVTVTSEDELAQLTTAFNMTQANTKQNLIQIQESQAKLVEQERLASLGQMVGGIAHNLKTPIMSIAGAMEGLGDLVNEYDTSIDDPDVTSQDHHAIAADMKDWIEKVNSYDAYMSDIITTVKGQATNFTDGTSEIFTLDELVKRVELLMRQELKKAFVSLNILFQIDANTELEGNINSLVQVLNNLIQNAIQSYNGVPNKTVDFVLEKDGNKVVMRIVDHGCGIHEDVQKKLFTEMITTRGNKGSGLGLYMSYSTIKGNFNGDLTFESKEGVGTTFTLTLPIKI